MGTYYDGNGNEIIIGDSINSKGEKISVLQGYTYTNKYGLTPAYANVIQQAKNAWLSAQNGDQRIIPLIIHTDQHGRLTANNPLFRFIDHIVNWESISKVCNLGDVVVGEFDNNATEDFTKNTELEAAVECMSYIPQEKQINIWGNHDYWLSNSLWLTDRAYLEQYFRSGESYKTNREGCYTVIDEKYNVKYVIVSGFQGDSTLVPDTTYYSYYFQSYIVDWLIKELSKADGYDIVILSHNRLSIGTGSTITNPISGTTSDGAYGAQNVVSIGANTDSFDALWTARKNKTSGSVTDKQGATHSYDFSECDSDLLCNLHGHDHTDSVWYDSSSGLLEAGFDYYLGNVGQSIPQAIHFALIDRADNKLKVWKVTTTPAVTTWETALTSQ